MQMTAADAARLAGLERQGEAEKQRRMDKARTAIQRYGCARDERNRAEAVLAINYYSAYASSEERHSWVLPLIEFAWPEIFWPAFMETWSRCDDTWDAQSRLRRAMKNASMPAEDFFSDVQRNFFEALPAQVEVFRGCSEPRVRSISWTTDRALAEGLPAGTEASECLSQSSLLRSSRKNIFSSSPTSKTKKKWFWTIVG